MTDKPAYPSDQADKVLVRMPDGMRDSLKEAAKSNSRTMNAEIVARLEGSFFNSANTEQLATLAADLAKAKRDSAYAAYISECWLVDAVFLWDMLLDAMKAAEALGVPELFPEDDRLIAEDIGAKVDDEFKRHSKEFDPMALHEFAEASEADYQKAVAGIARLISTTALPEKQRAELSSSIRDRIKKRTRREYLPADAYTDAEKEAFKKI